MIYKHCVIFKIDIKSVAIRSLILILSGIFVSIHSLSAQTYTRQAGKKNFEIKNHLGDVAALVNDVKHYNASIGTTTANVLSVSNFYTFGMEMPGRTLSKVRYRYGYNGMEKDDEIKGIGNSYTTEFRQYDPRVGRWLSIDPKFQSYPALSPYNAFLNNPVLHNDPKGEEPPVCHTYNKKWWQLPCQYTPKGVYTKVAWALQARFSGEGATLSYNVARGEQALYDATKVVREPVEATGRLVAPGGMLDKAAQRAADALSEGHLSPASRYVSPEEHARMGQDILTFGLTTFPGLGEVRIGIPGPPLVTPELGTVGLSTTTVVVPGTVVQVSAVVANNLLSKGSGSQPKREEPAKPTPEPEPTKGWIKKDLYKKLERLSPELLKDAEAALNKGLVVSEQGATGIKKLKGKGINGHLYELKMTGANSNKYRLLGDVTPWTHTVDGKEVTEQIVVFSTYITK